MRSAVSAGRDGAVTDINRPTMLKRIREVKELAEAAYWQLLDLRVLLDKAEAGLTAAEANGAELRSVLLGEDENHEGCQPGDSESSANS
jgi:hypothetical protein